MNDLQTIRQKAANARTRMAAGRLRTSNYDISSTCNLRCEGCLFFSGASEDDLRTEEDIEKWKLFFRQEAERGTNFAYLVGAEPSLVPQRIRAAHDAIPFGVVLTNGTKKIAKDITYRIHVSLWGGEAQSERYRGASVNSKAMKNYEGDPRAVFVLTLNNMNLGEIEEVASACRDHGLTLTFNLFSPTMDYNQRMATENADGTDYFRFSNAAEDMRFDKEGLVRVRSAILEAASTYPETVRISEDFVDWITQPGGIYSLDENGIATNCGNRLSRWHRHYSPDLRQNSGKCCSPNIDCRDCRAYAMSLGTYLTRRREIGKTPEGATAWPKVWDYWASLFLPLEWKEDKAETAEAARKEPALQEA